MEWNNYSVCAELYDKARPSYPELSVKFIASLIANSPNVVELAAGTGKLTASLFPLISANYLATDSSPSMIDVLKNLGIPTALASATNIPLPDRSTDVILVAQGFHWFANEAALREMHRVLKPTGLVVMLWNRDNWEKSPWTKEVFDLRQKFNHDNAPQYADGTWKIALEGDFAKQHFTHPKQQVYEHVLTKTRQSVWERMQTVSYISSLAKEQQALLHATIMQVLPESEVFEHHLCTDVFYMETK